jgi:hypothetical protein
MAKSGKTQRIILAVLVGLAMAGCVTRGTVKQVTAADASLLPGVWQGAVTTPAGKSETATLTVRSDGTYTTQAGAFSSTGKTELKDGHLQFISTSATGAVAVGERSGSAVLMDRGRSWALVGSGHSSAGPFNFDFSKPK